MLHYKTVHSCILLALGVLVDTLSYGPLVSASLSSPFFTSTSNIYRKEIGATVTFECRVENLGSSTLIWKKDTRMITAGSLVIRKDSRMRLIGQSLEIKNIGEEDAGEYICEVETFGAPLDQTHTLEVLVPARVSPKPSDGRIVVRKGSTITLECAGDGNPPPNITWTRQNNMLPSGEVNLMGESLVISVVSRHHTGLYICTADNGVGHPSHAKIDLQVLYPPELSIDQSWIRRKEGIESEISCVVHGEPAPEVKWFKETMLLEPTNHRYMEAYGNRRVLVLRNVGVQDFGNYSCKAENSLGRQAKTIEVSGRPHTAKVTSPPLSHSKFDYNLTWTVDSFITIQEYRILYRVILKTDDGLGLNGPTKHTEWTNIIPTLEPRHTGGGAGPEKGLTFSGSFNFFGLSPDTHYEVIIQSRNMEGWSDPSPIFKFATQSKDYDPRGMGLHKYNEQGFLSSGHTAASSPLALALAVLILVSTYRNTM